MSLSKGGRGRQEHDADKGRGGDSHDYAPRPAGVAGAFPPMSYTLSPSQMFAWMGVVFAVVSLGGLGNPPGVLAAGLVIGVSESLTMAVTAPTWAPLRAGHAISPGWPVTFGIPRISSIRPPERMKSSPFLKILWMTFVFPGPGID
jgi:hypothetical protein